MSEKSQFLTRRLQKLLYTHRMQPVFLERIFCRETFASPGYRLFNWPYLKNPMSMSTLSSSLTVLPAIYFDEAGNTQLLQL